MLVVVSVFSNCFNGPAKNCLQHELDATQHLRCVDCLLEDLIPELIFVEEIIEIAKIEVLDVPAVWKQGSVKSRGYDGAP
jgi:hypothetical protein